MTSDFLGPVTEIFAFARESCVLDSQNHFNESPFSLKPVGVGLLSILIQTWFQILHSQTQTEETICFSTIKSETLYSLLRIQCTHHQIQFTSIMGRSAQSVSKCVLGAALLIPEPLQAFTLPVPRQSCHFLDQRPRNTPPGSCLPVPRSLQMNSFCALERWYSSGLQNPGGVRDTHQSA